MLKKQTNKKAKDFLQGIDSAMACHTPPLKKAKKEGAMPLPSLSAIQSLKSQWDGMGNGISPGFLAF